MTDKLKKGMVYGIRIELDYAYGASGGSYAEGYAWVPIQFYKIGGK